MIDLRSRITPSERTELSHSHPLQGLPTIRVIPLFLRPVPLLPLPSRKTPLRRPFKRCKHSPMQRTKLLRLGKLKTGRNGNGIRRERG
jgi:hypothetical protein